MVFKFSHRLAATAVIAALALPALAQQQPPAAPTPAPTASGTAQHGHAHRADPQERHERREAHRAKRMAALKDQLKLTAAQEPAWTTYAAAMQPGERMARLDRKDMEKLTAPERTARPARGAGRPSRRSHQGLLRNPHSRAEEDL
jgi:hypothetical protein